jgi:hypothetical protein
MLNNSQNKFLYINYKLKNIFRIYLEEDELILKDLGYITIKSDNVIGSFEIRLTKKGNKYIESLSIDELLDIRDLDYVELIFCGNLYRRAIKRLSKEDLCIYLVHNNKYIRNIAKEVYDEK